VRALAVVLCSPLVFGGCARAEPMAHASPAVRASVSAQPTPVPSAAALPAPTPVAQATSAPEGPRVYAKTRFVWIRQEPDTSKQWIGYLWSGESAKLVTGKPVYGPGCNTWYAVEPVGFVCVDGLRATLDANDPGYVATKKYAADLSSPWPHQYGEAKGLKRLLAVEGSPLTFPNLPNSVHDGRVQLRHGSTVAFVSDVRVAERDYLLGADLSYIPKERVTPLPQYDFHGIDLGGEQKLPLAMFRGKDRPKLERRGDAFVETGEVFKRLSHVALTGKSEGAGKDKLLETADGWWVRAADAVVPVASDKPPWGTATPSGRATWMEVSVNGGWLIAYENTTPVFVTLISPGRGGAAKPNEDPIPEARTPLGVFPISGKFATATMEAPGNLLHTAVPWTQNFSGPHALHTAYWHDDWGNPKSGGCINVSPLDGKKLFAWTEPALPEGWHGTRWLPWRGPATILIVRR
jgi:L,D-transpeptidase catalytic domain